MSSSLTHLAHLATAALSLAPSQGERALGERLFARCWDYHGGRLEAPDATFDTRFGFELLGELAQSALVPLGPSPNSITQLSGRIMKPASLKSLSPIALLLSTFWPHLLLALLSTVNSRLSTAFGQGSLTPPGPPAPSMKSLAQIEPRTPISSLPFTINAAGSYYLT